MSRIELDEEAERATALLRGRSIKRVWRHRVDRVGVEFEDGTHLFVDNRDGGLELSITGCDGPREALDPAVTKNIQVVDGALNCVYDVFAACEDDYFFPKTWTLRSSRISNIARMRQASPTPSNGFGRTECPTANGIHRTLFCDRPEKRQYYPTLRGRGGHDPDGTKLRS